MVPPISVPKAYFVAVFCESTLHGMYTVLFMTAMYLLLFKRRMTRTNIAMICVTLIMYGFATTHDGLSLRQNLEAFFKQHAADGGPSVFDDQAASIVVTQIFLEATNIVIGDCVVVWRAWVLYDRRPWFLYISSFLLSGTAVGGYGLAHQFSVTPPGQTIFEGNIGIWALVTIVMTTLTNLWATTLIAYRAWAHSRNVRQLLGRPAYSNKYTSVLLLVIESGAVYALTWIICAITLASGTNGVYVVTDMLAQLTGIYPTLIVVLVCLKATQKDAISRFEATTRATHPNMPETLRFHAATRGTFSSGDITSSTSTSRGLSVADKYLGRGPIETIDMGKSFGRDVEAAIAEENVIELGNVPAGGTARNATENEVRSGMFGSPPGVNRSTNMRTTSP